MDGWMVDGQKEERQTVGLISKVRVICFSSMGSQKSFDRLRS